MSDLSELVIKIPKELAEALNNAKKENAFNYMRVYNDTLYDAIRNGTPLPKTGHWEWVQYGSNPNIGNWHCSECRAIIPHIPEETDNTPIYKWCPMCGTKMVELQKSESDDFETDDWDSLANAERDH